MRVNAPVIAALFLSAAIACTGEQVGPPPPPPSLPVNAPAPIPGQDDFARRQFAWPLSRADAREILLRTETFEFGGMPPKRQVQAFNVLFDQVDALEEFRRIGLGAHLAGQLYALCALSLLTPAEGDRLVQRLSQVSERVLVFDSDVVRWEPTATLVVLIRERRLGEDFRRRRAEVDAHFRRTAG